MKLGMRTPSLKKKLSSRTSGKRFIRHNVGIKAPKGTGIIKDPKKAIYNKVYNKTTFDIGDVIKGKNSRYYENDYEEDYDTQDVLITRGTLLGIIHFFSGLYIYIGLIYTFALNFSFIQLFLTCIFLLILGQIEYKKKIKKKITLNKTIIATTLLLLLSLLITGHFFVLGIVFVLSLSLWECYYQTSKTAIDVLSSELDEINEIS